MPANQPKKGKGKKVTVVPDPTSAPAAAPNPEVQAVLDAHIANVGSEHFPAGYFPIPYTLTPPDAESFPQPSPLRQPEGGPGGRPLRQVGPAGQSLLGLANGRHPRQLRPDQGGS